MRLTLPIVPESAGFESTVMVKFAEDLLTAIVWKALLHRKYDMLAGLLNGMFGSIHTKRFVTPALVWVSIT